MQLKPLESATLADTLEEEELLNLTFRVFSLGPNPNSQGILLRRTRLLVRMGHRGRAVWLVRQTTKGRLSPDAERLLLQQLNPSRAHHKLAKRVIDSDSEPLVNRSGLLGQVTKRPPVMTETSSFLLRQKE